MNKLSYAAASVVEPATQAFLDVVNANTGPAIYQLSVPDARGVLEGVQSGEVVKLDVEIEDLAVSGSLDLRVVRPPYAEGPLPVILYLHGGGWILGSKNTHDRLIRELSVGVGAAVVFVNYSPSPEAQYPVANEQAYAALEWVAGHGASHGLDASRIAVAGDSVGGNMAAAVTLMAKERSGPEIVRQVLFYPVTDDDFETGSYEAYQNGFFLSREAMRWFWDAYAPGTRELPTMTPLKASLEQLAGLPAALVITGENDVLRDEGEAYAHKLAAAGVTVTATRYLGTIHDFVMLNPLAETPAARGAIAQAIDYLRSAF